MVKKISFILFFLAFTANFFGQNSTCGGAQPFCTGQTMQFPAGVNTGNAQAGPNYGCLFSQPNPAWFYFQAATSGPMVITMSASNDIDFISWGPFPSLNSCGNLTSATQVPGSGYANPTSNGCSYSGSSTETLTIQNAVPGQYYIMLITNFSNQNQQISFSQSNSNAPGAGQTNCGVICSMTVSGTSTLCAGKTATLAVTTGTTVQSVQWNGPGGFNSNSYNPSVNNMTSSGVYTCIATTTGTNPATNTCSITKTITVIPNPTLTLTNNGPICAGATANFTGAGATLYGWTGPQGFISNVASPSIANAQQNNAGVYNVIGATNGCTATANTTLVVNANPTVTASNSGSYCAGQSFNLSGSGATSYTWSGPNSFSSNLQNPSFNNITPNLSGTYTLNGTSNSCTSTAVTLVDVHPLPTIVASSAGDICEGLTTTLSATGGTAFVWSGPSGFTSFQQSPIISNAMASNTGTYTVIGIDAFGCVNTSTIALIIYIKPVITAAGSNACVEESLNLTASGGNTYQWSGPNGYSSNQQNPIVPNISMASTGVYNVSVTSTGGCITTASVYCNVFQKPIVNYTGVAEVCKGGTFSFLGNGALNYKWLATYGIVTTNTLLTISSLSYSLQSTYTLVGADGNGCVNSVVVYPVVLGLPYGSVVPDKPGDCVPFCTKFSLEKGSPIITNVNWNFSNGGTFSDSTSVTQCFTSVGIHTLNIALTDSKGCKGSTTTTVEGYPIPKADFLFSPDSPTENDYNITFSDESKNAEIVKWYWDFYSNGKDTISNKTNPTYAFPEVGNYFTFLKVTSNHGCIDSTVKQITVVEDITFFIPNSFTPNGDGNNEIFMPKGVGVKKYRMDIFDRWGQLVFTSTDFNQGWDGKSKKGGDVLPGDVYVYKISLTNTSNSKPQYFTGHVTLIK